MAISISHEHLISLIREYKLINYKCIQECFIPKMKSEIQIKGIEYLNRVDHEENEFSKEECESIFKKYDSEIEQIYKQIENKKSAPCIMVNEVYEYFLLLLEVNKERFIQD